MLEAELERLKSNASGALPTSIMDDIAGRVEKVDTFRGWV